MSAQPDEKRSERYDVAFSFLNDDLETARAFRALLEPELSCFVYAERQEDVGGGDGMTKFAEVFRSDTRLAVILLRGAWGTTRWTAIEEAAIKARALDTGHRSYMVVAMEPSPKIPSWIPDYIIYQHGWREPRADTAAVIKARAREAGAVLKTETVVDVARRRAALERTRLEREDYLRSPKGAAAARAEFERLLAELTSLVAEIDKELPNTRLSTSFETVNPGRVGGVISAGTAARLALWWDASMGLTLAGPPLQVGHFHPNRAKQWSIYRFVLDEDGAPAWLLDGSYDDPGSGVVRPSLPGQNPIPAWRFAEDLLRPLVDELLRPPRSR